MSLLIRALAASATCLLLFGSARAAQPSTAPPSAGVPSNRVLVIGIDGLRHDALARANTPHLDALITTGAFTNTAQMMGDRFGENDTISGPTWSSILTGVWADKHGVMDNKFTVKHYDQYPHFFQRVKVRYPQAQTVSLVSWDPIHKHILAAADIAHSLPMPKPGDGVPEDALGRERYRDGQMSQLASEILQTENPHAMFVYFHQVDATGHTIAFSPGSPEYIGAIEDVDQQIGKVLASLRARPQFEAENWLVLVCTDHGGIERTHSNGHQIPEIREVFLIANGASVTPGTLPGQVYVVDVAATALQHLLGELETDWGLDGKPVGN